MPRDMLKVLAICLSSSSLAASPPATVAVHASLTTHAADQHSTREASYLLHLDEQRFRLDLGLVRILGDRASSPHRLIAWHVQDPDSIFFAQGPQLSTLLRTHVPPLWCWPLAEWFNESDPPYSLVGHHWPSQPAQHNTADQSLLLIAGNLSIERAEHPSTGLPASEFIRVNQNTQSFELNLTYDWQSGSPLPDPFVDVQSRARVPSISALKPKPPSLTVGQIITGITLLDPQGRAWPIASAFDPEPDTRAERFASRLLLVFIVAAREESTATTKQDIADFVDVIAQAREQHARDAAAQGIARSLIIVRPVVVFDVAQFGLQRVLETAAPFTKLPPDTLLTRVESAVPPQFATHPPDETIDRFAPGAQLAVLVLDDQRRIVDTIVVEPRIDDWKRRLTRIINPLAAPPAAP